MGYAEAVKTHRDPSTGEEFISLLHGLHRELRRHGAGAEVAPGQIRMLRVLARAGEPIRLGQLATHLDIAPRSATAKVDAAVRDGLIVRTPDPADRRAALISLTPKAHDILAQAHSARGSAAEVLLQELSASEQQQLLELLRRIRSADLTDCPPAEPGK